MSVAERDFSSFELRDNVYELAGGLIPEIADRFEVDLGPEPNQPSLQAVMDKVGTGKVLRENEEITVLDRDEMADIVERSGVQQALSRSLWTPTVPVNKETIDAFLIVGGVANWMDRSAEALPAELQNTPVYLLAGNRVMDTATEKTNPHVQSVYDVGGMYPTEATYAAGVLVPRILEKDFFVERTVAYPTGNGDELFEKLFQDYPELLYLRIALARNANAGVIMAMQMRAAARKYNQAYDANPAEPQALIVTDSFPVARTDEQDNDPAHYQKAATALRQVVLTAKKLVELQTQLD